MRTRPCRSIVSAVRWMRRDNARDWRFCRGTVALRRFLPRLSSQFDGAIIVMSHLGPGGGDLLVNGLRNICGLPVRLAMEREPVERGVIHIAPEGYHLLIEYSRRFSYSVDERVSFSRPSIDVLFASAARVYRKELVGLVLSGANADGAEGLRIIRRLGERHWFKTLGRLKCRRCRLRQSLMPVVIYAPP